MRCIEYLIFLSRRGESNPRPADYKSAALPTELLRHKKQELSLFFGMAKVMENLSQQNIRKEKFISVSNNFYLYAETLPQQGFYRFTFLNLNQNNLNSGP